MKKQQEQIITASSRGTVVRLAFVLAVLLLFTVAMPAQAQKMPFSFTTDEWFEFVNPRHPVPYYLPSYDGDLYRDWMIYSCFLSNVHGYRCSHRYDRGYWYPWTFRWGRYDIPNNSWWTFGEGYFDEYGTGVIWTAEKPLLMAERKARSGQAIQRREPAVRVARETPGMTRRSSMGSSGISASGGSSFGSSGGGSSIGSSGGGSRGGKK